MYFDPTLNRDPRMPAYRSFMRRRARGRRIKRGRRVLKTTNIFYSQSAHPTSSHNALHHPCLSKNTDIDSLVDAMQH